MEFWKGFRNLLGKSARLLTSEGSVRYLAVAPLQDCCLPACRAAGQDVIVMIVKKPNSLSAGVTLQAVAKAAGVTIATASRSLNDAYGVHPEPRARVLQIAGKLRYTPNRFARGLVTGRSDMIGLIVSDVRNAYFAEVARGAEDAALETGRDVMLCNSDLSAERQMKSVISLLDKRAEAIAQNSNRLRRPACPSCC